MNTGALVIFGLSLEAHETACLGGCSYRRRKSRGLWRQGQRRPDSRPLGEAPAGGSAALRRRAAPEATTTGWGERE